MPVPAGLLQAGLSEIAESANGPFALLLRRLGSGGVGPPGPPGPPGPSAASVANVAALAALPTAGFLPGTIVLVQSMWDFWNYDPFDVTSVPDGITIVPAAGGGFWHRMEIPDQLWIHQTSWFIDSVAGNDENDGATALTALQTHPEYNRRVGGPTRTLRATDPNIFITLVGDVGDVFADILSGGPTVTYQGALPAPSADAVAAVTAPDPTTQTPFTVTTVGTWGGQKLVHDTTNDTWFWAYDDLANVAQASPPSSALPLYMAGPLPVPGDALLEYDPTAFAQMSNFSLSGSQAAGLFTPAIACSLLRLGNGQITDQVAAERCILRGADPSGDPAGTVFRGSVSVISICAHLFAATVEQSIVGNAILVTGGCTFDSLITVETFVNAIDNNFNELVVLDATWLTGDHRMMSLANIRVQPSSLQVTATGQLVSQTSLWSDANPAASLQIQASAQVLCPGPLAGLAAFNISSLAIGNSAPKAVPRLVPGAAVPVDALCNTPLLLFGGTFMGVAYDYETMSRIEVT